MEAKEIVDKYYYNMKEPYSFSGFSRFSSRFPHINREELKNYLEGEDAFTLHKPVRKKFPTRKTIAPYLDSVWQLDLTEMVKYKAYNDGIQYILFVIDVYSRYLWLKALKDKKSKTVATAVREIINDDNRYPQMIWTDRGSEFLGRYFQEIIIEYDIGYYNTFSVNKAAIVERVQRSIKERMHRYFTKMNTFKYIDILQDMAYSYNRSFHRTIKTTPLEMVKTKPSIPQSDTREIKDNSGIKVGDYVRVSRTGDKFKKGYESGWSREIFKVVTIREFPRDGLKLYYLEDLAEEKIKGGFYKQEIERVRFDPKSNVYKIEKILGSKGIGRNKQYFVQWLGYPDKFNSYIKASEIERY